MGVGVGSLVLVGQGQTHGHAGAAEDHGAGAGNLGREVKLPDASLPVEEGHVLRRHAAAGENGNALPCPPGEIAQEIDAVHGLGLLAGGQNGVKPQRHGSLQPFQGVAAEVKGAVEGVGELAASHLH